MSFSRRQFVTGCSAAIAAMAGGSIGNLFFQGTAQAAGGNGEVLVVVFLRGGCDGLSLVSPFDNSIYRSARQRLAIPTSGDNSAIVIDPKNGSYSNSSSFGLHPSAAPLKELYDQQKLAIVHACGLDDDTRSHFDAMDYMELGTPGKKNIASGWLARHLEMIDGDGYIPVLAADSSTPTSLLGNREAIAVNDAKSYGLNSPWRYNNDDNDTMFQTLKQFYTGNGAVQNAGRRTIETIETLKSESLDYEPEPGAEYPEGYPGGGFSKSLQTVAQMIKLDMGLQVATVNLGGWDTHDGQGNDGTGRFASLTDTLSRGLHAFYNDLPNHHNKVTVVVMSEFGRRLGANASSGTDHGHGNAMLILGGNVNGGKMYGEWPGLEDLDQDQDLRITTDYRKVLSEVIVRRFGNGELGTVFPGITEDIYAAQNTLNFINGSDVPINYESRLPSNTVYLPMIAR
ncbi:MAG: hypothetical protein GFH24_608346n17 [Chloroflexi bacterium AL-N5]|nr:hypothetical protein [Chloroflexi bacterium AL-N5]